MQKENIAELVDRKILAALALGVILGGASLTFADSFTGSNPDQAAQKLINTLEESSGQNLELVSIDEQNGLYRAQISNQDNQLTTYYITKDGEIVIQESGITNLTQFQRTVNAQAEFANCMEERNVVLYGNSSQRETLTQIQLLGGTNRVEGIYRDVNSRETLREAINNGIRRIPGFYHDNSTLQGVQTYSALENFTGCSYDAN